MSKLKVTVTTSLVSYTLYILVALLSEVGGMSVLLKAQSALSCSYIEHSASDRSTVLIIFMMAFPFPVKWKFDASS